MARAILILMMAIGSSAIALAQSGSPEEQTACRPDVRRFCHKVSQEAGSNAFLQCLQEHREKLSPRCRAVLDSHGA